MSKWQPGTFHLANCIGLSLGLHDGQVGEGESQKQGVKGTLLLCAYLFSFQLFTMKISSKAKVRAQSPTNPCVPDTIVNSGS